MVNKPDLDDAQEVPVKTGVDNKNKNFGNLVPDSVDVDEGFAGRRDSMRRNPDNEYRNVDCGNQDGGAPLDVSDGASMFSNECDSVDNNLHEHLDLEHPKEEDKEQDRNTA